MVQLNLDMNYKMEVTGRELNIIGLALSQWQPKDRAAQRTAHDLNVALMQQREQQVKRAMETAAHAHKSAVDVKQAADALDPEEERL